jgi:peptidoglycan lytic transglycosylase G
MAVRRVFSILLLLVVLAVGVSVVAVWRGWKDIHEAYKGYDSTEQYVTVRQGASSVEIGRALADAHVVRDPRSFRLALWWTGNGRSLKAGEYRFDRAMTPLDVIDVIVRGDVYTQKITFPEGLTLEEMSKLYESRGFGRARDFLEASRNVERITDVDSDATDLEGYLFPETYALPRNVGAARLVNLMVDRFRSVYSEQLRARAAGEGMTTRQVVTLASLVEKETGKAEERPLVAAVFRNRMKIGMPMQADPTIVYALEKAHRYDGNIRKIDLSMESPYNTYKHPGLPPGPIASPGKASLEAALSPANVSYLYFVSRNDGSHVFASTLAEHDSNVRRFQVDFFRQQRQAQTSSARPTSTSRGAARSSRVPAP